MRVVVLREANVMSGLEIRACSGRYRDDECENCAKTADIRDGYCRSVEREEYRETIVELS